MPTAADHWSGMPGRWPSLVTPEAIAAVPTISTPRPSPDGRLIAYSRGYDGRNDLWVVEANGGPARQLTDQVTLQGADPNQRHASAIAWTPDSREVIYAAGGDGKLRIVDAAGGLSRAVDEGPGSHHSPAVAPDGSRVAYVAERGEQGDILVADLAGRWYRTISQGDEYVLQPRWSPDGRSLLYGQWPHYDMPWDERALVVADPESGALRVIAGGTRVINADHVWSPDGRQIAYVSDRDSDFANLWVIEADGSNARRLVTENNRHQTPAWSPNGRQIAYTRNEQGACQIWCWEDGQTRQITSAVGVWAELSWLDDERLVGVFSSSTKPNDLYVVNVRTGEQSQLTHSATGGVLGGGLVQPEVVEWQSTDGLPIQGLLFTPREQQPGQHPLIINIHGGPVGQSMQDWRGASNVQYLVSRGYQVLSPNYRGSLGYGRAFMEKLYGDWGGGDLQDHISGAKFVLKRGLADRRKVIAMGGSAGGYGTLICITKAPEFFRAGVCRFGIAELASFTDKTWIFERHYIAKLMGPQGGDNSELYRDRSPITFVTDVREPVLILQGEEDIVCHPSQMAMMFDALKRAGKDVEYHTYPGEGHGWRRFATLVDDAKRVDDFLTRKVLNR